MTKTLLLTTLLSASLAFPVLAQETHPETGQALSDNQVFTYRELDAIKSMDPHINTDVAGSDVLRSLFEGLMNEGPTGELQPGVATGFEMSEDQTVYTFTLRDDAKWSNGDPVTAGDFVYAWRRLADPATASEYAWYMELMQVVNAEEIIAGEKPVEELGVRAVDDRTFEVTIKAPLPYFPQMTVHASTFPVHQATIEAHGDNWTEPGNLVGNGAFVLTQHVLGERVEMEPNPEYWEAGSVILDKIVVLTINDENQALTRYLAGELDKTDVPAGQFPRLSAEYPDQATSTPYSCSYIYMFNLDPATGHEALQDVNIRRALSYAINRDVIVDNVLQGGQQPSYNWTHWATAGFDMPEIDYASWTQEERNAKAVELLTAAGYGPDNPLELTLNYNTSESHKKIAIAVQQFWKQVGVNLTLNNMEWKVHLDRMRDGDFQMARYAWCGDYNEPSTYLDLFASYSGHNNGKFFNDEYDALMEASKTAEDPSDMYTQAEQILATEMPFAPIYHYAQVDMLSADIKGMPTDNVMQTWYAKELYRVAE